MTTLTLQHIAHDNAIKQQIKKQRHLQGLAALVVIVIAIIALTHHNVNPPMCADFNTGLPISCDLITGGK